MPLAALAKKFCDTNDDERSVFAVANLVSSVISIQASCSRRNSSQNQRLLHDRFMLIS